MTENVVIPDGIEPVEGFRSWRLVGKQLIAINAGIAWKPGEPIEARCHGGHGPTQEWKLVRGGLSPEEALERFKMFTATPTPSYGYYITFGGSQTPPFPPKTVPPQGFGYVLGCKEHDSPDERCTCGIYAATSMDAVPSGDVYGKVKMWGKVIPGDRGYRAQFAYPSEFYVKPGLERHPTLLEFGVPISVQQDLPESGRPHPDRNRNLRRLMWFATGLNFACATFNIVTMTVLS